MDSVLHRIPVVAGLAYIERVRRLPSAFIAALVPEPENRCFQNAVAVLVDGDKIGYLAPELCRGYFAPLVARGSAVLPGAVFTEAAYPYAGTYTCAGHATISTCS